MKKTALVTGGSRGIGAAIARLLSRDGWTVYLNYNRSRTAAETLAAELNGTAVAADVSDPAAVHRMFSETGGVDLLVNNAGTAYYGLLSEMDDDAWARVTAVNLGGVFNCCKCAIPHMVRKKSGVIINIASMWGITGASCEVAYSASKAGVIGFTRALAKELGPSGIRVNCVAPGVVDTDMLANLTDADKRELSDNTPLGRLGTAHDIAELVTFLASERAAFITGQVITADGGFS